MADRATRLHAALDRICDGIFGHVCGPSGITEEPVRDSAFEKLERKLSHKPGITDPAALSAAIGRKSLGQAEMTRRSVAGRAHDYIPPHVPLPGGEVALTDRRRRLHAAMDVVCDRKRIA